MFAKLTPPRQILKQRSRWRLKERGVRSLASLHILRRTDVVTEIENAVKLVDPSRDALFALDPEGNKVELWEPPAWRQWDVARTHRKVFASDRHPARPPIPAERVASRSVAAVVC